MKIYTNQLSLLLDKIADKQIKSLLLYGYDRGFISFVINQLASRLKLLTTCLTHKEASSGHMELLANRSNFFHQQELIKVEYNSSAISKELTQFLLSGNFVNFICFVANESLPASGIRKLFEDSPNLAIMPCYYNDDNMIAKIAVTTAKGHSKTFSPEALSYLKTTLKGDYQLITNELTKVFYYTHNKKQIDYQDVKEALSDISAEGGDMLCIFFSQKKPIQFINEVEKLQNQGINEVLIIRALLRYYINLFIVTSKIKQGEHIDSAVKSLTPPIFFKYLNDFKQTAQKISVEETVKIIEILQNSEIKFKTNNRNFNIFIDTYLPASDIR